MDDSMKPIHLLCDELNYELKIRGIVTTRDISAKRKILARALEKERFRPLQLADNEFDFENEQQAINNTLESINTLILEFEGPASDSLCKRIKSRLIHVTDRVKRMSIPEGDEIAKVYKNETYATCLEYEATLQEKIVVEQPLLNLESPAIEHNLQVIHTPVPVTAKAVPVYKWNVRFDGGSPNSSVVAFLERVDELAQARSVSKNDLFSSAVDLFSGKALIWYRSIKNTVSDWDSLVSLLKHEFLPSDYDDRLWDELKQRSQGHDEPVTLYIAVMETIFSRLARPPSEITRVKHIKQNLLPHYVTQLALSEVKTVAELGILCRKLEEASSFRSKHRTCSKPIINVIEPELAYLQNPSTSFAVPQNSQSKSLNKNKTENKHPTLKKRNVVCWNCNQPNHTYTNCTEKRKIFCYRCGKPNTTVAKCSHSGNA